MVNDGLNRIDECFMGSFRYRGLNRMVCFVAKKIVPRARKAPVSVTGTIDFVDLLIAVGEGKQVINSCLAAMEEKFSFSKKEGDFHLPPEGLCG